MEKIYIVGDDGPAHIILAAVSMYTENNDAHHKFYTELPNGANCNVELLVNGHSVPVIEALADIWRRFDETVEERAGKLALKMVTESGLEPVSKALDEAKRGIIAALEKVGFKPDENTW